MQISEIQKIYNENAQKYKESMQDFSFPEGMLEYFLEHLPGKSVLDIGCGFGRDVLEMRKLGYNAYGIDISEKLLSLADESIQQHLTHGNILTLGQYFTKTSFDGIFSSASLVHLEKEKVQKVLSDSHKLLKKGGCILISTKIRKDNEPLIITKKSLSTPGVEKIYYYYTPEEMKKMLENLGFRIIKTHFHIPKVDSWGIFIAQK